MVNLSTTYYTSSVTIEESLLQSLASAYAMGVPGEASDKTHSLNVLIVATHKDKLRPIS